ncbi:serine hydrolase domain-containing protein [Glaciibacter superstes]|uniref:serine hydrolase domain-containing protein n=1 Tax=Glaciibacter superstes TaxID=501023 RepID=UPI0003B47C3B|nr:serine hydrolase domain-containing protein [Glaciibacter superstes]
MAREAGRARRRFAVALIAVAALVLSACTSAADANDAHTQVEAPFDSGLTERLDAALAEAMTLAGASGAIAGVWAPWAGQWVVAPGTTTIDGGTSMSTDMRFRIAANTRSMTCTVLLRLVDEGRVKLSDTIDMYLKRASGVEKITLGQLCQNTSGLADYNSELAPHFVNNPTRIWPPLEVVSSGIAANRVSEPGGAFASSDTGYVLLGLTLQAATNQDWDSLYKQYIFDPLDLDATSFPAASELEIAGSHPHGYAAALAPDGSKVCEVVRDETELSNSMRWVSGGVVSDLEDMKVWSQALADGRLLSEKSSDAQWATIPLGGDTPSWQAYGLGVQQLGPMRGHAGAIPGFLSAMLVDPASGLTIVVMLNNSNAGAGFAQTLAERLASIASKAPSAGEESAPLLELPWSEEQTVATMQAAAVCQPPPPPAEEPPAEEPPAEG